jgi:hypothetical protein
MPVVCRTVLLKKFIRATRDGGCGCIARPRISAPRNVVKTTDPKVGDNLVTKPAVGLGVIAGAPGRFVAAVFPAT